MNRTIYDTMSVRFTINKAHLKSLIKFLIANRDIVDTRETTRSKLTVKSSMTTSMSQLYDHLVFTEGFQRSVRTLTIDESVSSIPEMLTFRHIPFDMTQISTVLPDMARSLRSMPEYTNSLLVNTSSLLSSRGEIIDTLTFQSNIVRDILSRTYHQANENWLTPDQAKYVVRVYSMTISQALSSVFKLTQDQKQRVSIIFSYFYLTQLVDPEDAAAVLTSGPKDLGLLRDDSIQDTIDLIEHVYPPTNRERMTLDTTFDILDRLAIPRLKVNRKLLNSRLGKLGGDLNTSAISLEYPPYFIYLIGLAASGAKNRMNFMIKNSPKGIPAANEFMTSLIRNNTLHT